MARKAVTEAIDWPWVGALENPIRRRCETRAPRDACVRQQLRALGAAAHRGGADERQVPSFACSRVVWKDLGVRPLTTCRTGANDGAVVFADEGPAWKERKLGQTRWALRPGAVGASELYS